MQYVSETPFVLYVSIRIAESAGTPTSSADFRPNAGNPAC